MLNVEERVTTWRAEARLGSTLSEEELDELEGHLRDRVDAQVASGLDSGVAWEGAVARLGEVAPIDTEYSKVRMPNRVRDRLVWMLAGYVLFGGIQQVARLVATFAAGPGFPTEFGDAWAHVGLLSIHALVLTGLVVVALRGAVKGGRPRQEPGSSSNWRGRLHGKRWPAAAMGAASLLIFLTSALAIDYGQWWATALHAGASRALGLTNFWLDLFEIAFAPALAIAAIFLIWRSVERTVAAS